MNSFELQKIFYTTYKGFFNKHNIVLSGGGVLTWWADISHGVSALRIKQKLPVKTFCGVNFNTSGKVTFWQMWTYSILENSFEESELNTFFKQNADQVSGFIKNFLYQHGYHGGIEIDFLFEAPPWHGFAFSGVISVLLTFLIHTLVKQLDIKTLVGREFPIDPILFDTLYNSSLRLSSCISWGKSAGGSSNYIVMAHNYALPIVHVSQKCEHRNLHENIMDEENTDIHRCINTVIYRDSLLNFLWKDPLWIDELPIDYGVIFTGLEYRFADIEATREQRVYEEEKLTSFIATIVDALPVADSDRTILAKMLNFDKDEVIYKNIDHMNLKILEWFNTLFRRNNDDLSIEAFIDTIRKIGLSSFSYQKENRLFLALQYLFQKYQQFDDEEIGILPFNTGRTGGSLFFVMKKWQSRITIQKALDHLRDEWNIVSLDHASWRDGYSSDGVRVEQYITGKIFSEYTREGDVLFSDSFGESYSGDYDTMRQNETHGILLDAIWGRIYLDGVKLTSKDIHSQNTTIDMLKLLLDNLGKEVPNIKLPSSTYSHNKNEILSKIIIPIKRITKEHFWKEIALSCSGWITEYYLRLEHDPSLRISIIQKLQH